MHAPRSSHSANSRIGSPSGAHGGNAGASAPASVGLASLDVSRHDTQNIAAAIATHTLGLHRPKLSPGYCFLAWSNTAAPSPRLLVKRGSSRACIAARRRASANETPTLVSRVGSSIASSRVHRAERSTSRSRGACRVECRRQRRAAFHDVGLLQRGRDSGDVAQELRLRKTGASTLPYQAARTSPSNSTTFATAARRSSSRSRRAPRRSASPSSV